MTGLSRLISRLIERAANERVTGPRAGDIMRYTLAPILGRVMWPLVLVRHRTAYLEWRYK
jgi:hypothetical protein